MTIPSTQLPNGVQIPSLGFGTYKVTQDITPTVISALEVGYRHIDTAQMYGNEAEVGRAWTDFGIERTDLFLTSKLDDPNHMPEDARKSMERTLNDLQTDYVDLFLIHWPLPHDYGGDFAMTWKVLEEFYAKGLARAIGVSNYEPHHLEKLLPEVTITPHANQIESHPYFVNEAVHVFNARHGIITEAWSPLARGRVLTDPLLTTIAKEYGKTPSQVALRWGLQRGDVLFPKASTRERQEENFDLFDFELSDDHMAMISTLDKGNAGRSGSSPDQRRLGQ